SIIEQNANVFKDILGEENVLEHHSNFSYDDEAGNPILEKQKLAAENWDSPVIVTTTVQFFESLFASKTSKCRKLHNLANSVIIFDEAQMFPLPYLKPCVRVISELVYNYGTSVVLCSATQPNLGGLFPKELQSHEICDNTEELFRFFKRTNINLIGELDDQELADRLNRENQVLCIVNTRKHAQNIFNLLDGDGCYHLSTFMYPQHRKAILKEIRERLKNGLDCQVISTSLIEAGVDVDFPVVYRAEAGLDSLIQAAGRCNREGNWEEGPVYVFKPSKEYRTHMPEMIKRSTGVANTIAYQFEDISSLEAITCFFSEIYRLAGSGLDIQNIVARFEDGIDKDFSFPFAEIASQFHLIDNATRVIIISKCNKAKALVERLRNGERTRSLLRSIQQYSVNVYEGNYRSLYDAGSIQPLDDELAVLIDETKYNEKTGLDVSADNGVGIFV
ncbi:MAG TPA: helicase-related protein, partial [Anaerovoracaceae bacterium]|nr:helicase-related protein [Anaerovoracaceae bacterium]